MSKWIFIIITLFLLFLLRKALIPLAIGILLAYLLDPLVCRIEEKFHISRIFAILFSYLFLFVGIIFLLVGFVNMADNNLPGDSFEEGFQTIKSYYIQYQSQIHAALPFTKELPAIGPLIRQVGSSLFKGFVAWVISVYLLKDKVFFMRQTRAMLHLILPQKQHGYIRELFFEVNQVVTAFLRGVLVDSVIVSFLASLALTLLQIDYAILIGCFVGITNIIPYFGPIIGIIPAVFAAYTRGSWLLSLWAAGLLVLIQQLECNYIYPRIIGKSTGLHPLFVLLAVSVAGYYGGLVSMILAVPAAGILKVILCKWADSL